MESNEQLYCLACQKTIGWNNRYCQCSTTMHVDKKEKYLKAVADAKTGDNIFQMCISAEALTGVNYDKGRNGNTFMWV